MRPRLDSCGGTFTDAAGRLKTSCSASRPVIRHAGLGEAGLPAPGILRGSAVAGALPDPRSSQLPHRAHARVRRPGSWPRRRGGHATVREVTGWMRGIPPGVGRPDPWRINDRTRALPAARTNLPSRRAGCLATQTCDGDGHVSARINSPSSGADTGESPLRVQLEKLTGHVTTHGNPTARLP